MATNDQQHDRASGADDSEDPIKQSAPHLLQQIADQIKFAGRRNFTVDDITAIEPAKSTKKLEVLSEPEIVVFGAHKELLAHIKVADLFGKTVLQAVEKRSGKEGVQQLLSKSAEALISLKSAAPAANNPAPEPAPLRLENLDGDVDKKPAEETAPAEDETPADGDTPEEELEPLLLTDVVPQPPKKSLRKRFGSFLSRNTPDFFKRNTKADEGQENETSEPQLNEADLPNTAEQDKPAEGTSDATNTQKPAPGGDDPDVRPEPSLSRPKPRENTFDPEFNDPDSVTYRGDLNGGRAHFARRNLGTIARRMGTKPEKITRVAAARFDGELSPGDLRVETKTGLFGRKRENSLVSFPADSLQPENVMKMAHLASGLIDGRYGSVKPANDQKPVKTEEPVRERKFSKNRWNPRNWFKRNNAIHEAAAEEAHTNTRKAPRSTLPETDLGNDTADAPRGDEQGSKADTGMDHPSSQSETKTKPDAKPSGVETDTTAKTEEEASSDHTGDVKTKAKAADAAGMINVILQQKTINPDQYEAALAYESITGESVTSVEEISFCTEAAEHADDPNYPQIIMQIKRRDGSVGSIHFPSKNLDFDELQSMATNIKALKGHIDDLKTKGVNITGIQGSTASGANPARPANDVSGDSPTANDNLSRSMPRGALERVSNYVFNKTFSENRIGLEDQDIAVAYTNAAGKLVLSVAEPKSDSAAERQYTEREVDVNDNPLGLSAKQIADALNANKERRYDVRSAHKHYPVAYVMPEGDAAKQAPVSANDTTVAPKAELAKTTTDGSKDAPDAKTAEQPADKQTASADAETAKVKQEQTLSDLAQNMTKNAAGATLARFTAKSKYAPIFAMAVLKDALREQAADITNVHHIKSVTSNGVRGLILEMDDSKLREIKVDLDETHFESTRELAEAMNAAKEEEIRRGWDEHEAQKLEVGQG